MNQIFLQANSPIGGGFSMIIMIVAVLGLMYFLTIRPQQRRQKQAKKFLEELQKGQWIVTIGGIHGRLVELSENTAIIDTKAGQLTIERSGISLELTQARYGNK